VVSHASATTSGLLLLPLMAGLLLTSITSGRLIARTGRYKRYPIVGTALIGVGLSLMSTMGMDTTRLASGVYMFVLGLGIGLVMQVMVLVVQSNTARSDLGVATASVNFSRQMGGSLGVAFVGALFVHRLGGVLATGLVARGDSALSSRLSDITPQGLSALAAPARHAIVDAFASALPPVFAYLIPASAIAFLLALALQERPLRGEDSGDTESAAARAHVTGGRTEGESWTP
jgi:MFS family permease